MKKIILALGAAVLTLAGLQTTAQAQPIGSGIVQAQVWVAPGPQPRHDPRVDPRRYHAPPPPHYRHDRRWDDRRWNERRRDDRRQSSRRDFDGDGVPNRYDRRPNNPYRH